VQDSGLYSFSPMRDIRCGGLPPLAEELCLTLDRVPGLRPAPPATPAVRWGDWGGDAVYLRNSKILVW
jgi:hypothetical protein